LKVGAATNGNLSIVSGTVTAPEIWVGHGGSSVATQSGGDVTTVNLSHADSGSGSYTMTGGNLTVKSIYNSSDGASGTFTFAMNGGTLRAAVGTTNLMTTGGNLTRPQLEVQLGNTGATIDTSSSSATINRPMGDMSGQNGTLTKIGSNTLTLNATNTYTGDTIVSGGTLAVTGSSIANSGNLVINSGGKVNLTGDETVNTLFFGATPQPRGTYRASHSSTNFTGSGTLIVTDGPIDDPYSIWANTFLPSNDVSNPAGDNDNDGMTNQQEFAFGLSPINGSSVNPIIAQPDQSSGTFTYQRRADTGLTYKILRSTDLVTWSEDSTAVQLASATDGVKAFEGESKGVDTLVAAATVRIAAVAFD
jgi:autotransporter-associated beta strand protein